MLRAILLALPLLAVAGCERRSDDVPVVVSVLPDSGADEGGARKVVRTALAQGLVRFDAAGQVEPALAERWNMVDGGRGYIFRLGDATWSDGRPVTAEQVVTALKRAVRPGAGHRLTPFLRSVEDVVAMTPQVIEVRLRRPNTELLTLLAQPELAITRGRRGSGPLRRLEGAGIRLHPPADPDPDAVPATPAEEVRVRGERAALAVARFADKRSDLILGGGFADWPLAAAAGIAPGETRVDPAVGLFGFAFTDRTGFLAAPLGRTAVAMALQEGSVQAGVDPNWAAAATVLPARLDSARDPALPPWSGLTPDQRIAVARQQVTAWQQPVRLRVALPSGPGATLLWGRVATALRRIGVGAERVAADAPADLRLIDRVAPYDSARWYLATACRPCSPEAMMRIAHARDAGDLPERARRLAAADAALAADVAFVTIARPWRWSLVARRLDGFQPNARAVHPLNHLRADPR